MTGVTIYMEGGGDSRHLRAELRQGMDGFLAALKNQVRSKRRTWKLIPCGGRQEAYEAFVNARRRPAGAEIIVLLVDSEGPVATATRAQYLRMRQSDQWDLIGVAEDTIHLMIQCMEAWIIADPEALAAYFGHYFNASALPNHRNLEEASKLDVAQALANATRHTTKGAYQKIRDASALLRRIDPNKVSARCPSCKRMFTELGALIDGA